MDKKNTIKKIDKLFDTASDLAEKLVESEARKILAADRELDEFVMSMGGCFFTTENEERGWCPRGGGSNIINEDQDDLAPEFFEMVEDLNDKFKIMGCPMRFTANGETIRNW